MPLVYRTNAPGARGVTRAVRLPQSAIDSGARQLAK
jgi:hypothetical protein